MATTLTDTTFSTTYRDDFRDSDNYHRILFNAGRALQARELTQMQTIINKEMERFGSNIFREGAIVRAGNVTINTTYEFIKLDTTLNPLPSNPNDLVGLELTVKAPNPAIKVRVLQVVEAADGDPATLYVRYTDTSAGISGTDAIRVPNGAELEGTGITDLKVASADATGRGATASVESGDYFVQGHFVFAEKQTEIISKYSPTPTVDVGFLVVETVVSEDDDAALYDNQGASPNIASPGADRYRIRLTLTTRDEINSDDNFVYIARVNDGIIIDQASGDDAYNQINAVLALRTKEESGDYVVRPFIASFDDLNDSNLNVEVSPGTAYVDGYRLNIPVTNITLPKAQDTVSLTSQNVIAQYGNFIVGDASDNKGVPNIATFDQISLMNDSSFAGTELGTARVRAVQEDGANHNYYLFDVQMNTGASFRNVRSFGNDSNDYVNVVLEDGIAQLKSTANNSLLFPLPNSRPSSTGVSMTSLTIQKRYTFTTDGAGNKTGQAAGSGFTFTDQFQWVVTEESGAIANPTITLGAGNTQADFSGLDPSTNYILLAYVIKSSVAERTKSLNANETLTVSWPTAADSDGSGNRFIDLGTSDIFRLRAVKQTDSDGADLSTNFIFDNGQRDNFYAKGRLIERGGVSIPSGNIFVKFDHFTHGATGDFFSVNSYDGVVDYEDIPNHRKNNGETINLRDVLDFRPVQDTSGGFTGSEGIINPLPQNTDAITGTVEYFQARKDRLVASVENSRDGRFGRGAVQLIQGVPDLDPRLPETPTGSIPLYDITLNPFTLNDSDIETSFYTNKRFTMKDIATLERRLDNLQELTTLSLLELNTSSFEVLDSAGLSRTKAGFLADNFKDYAFSDASREEYRAAIDPAENVLKPQQYPNAIRLVYDSDEATNTVARKGDFLVLPFSNVSLINQNLATATINVNPFAVITQTGHTDLSPASDTWVETEFAPDNIIDGGTITRNVGTRTTTNNLATWRNSWFGRPVGNSVQVVTDSRIIRELVGTRVIDISIIPFMRSIKVAFRSRGLRPNTRFFPFFGGVSIADWTREESTFTRFVEDGTDVGNTYTNLSGHPDGSTNLVSDSDGTIIGSFVIPSTVSLKFRTGEQEFKLLDISIDDEANSTSLTRATFLSTGTIETVQRTIRSTRQIDLTTINRREEDRGGRDDTGSDPLAQSFRIDQRENPGGVFLSKIRLYFATKDDNIPVEVQIRPMENGVPTGTPLPGSVVFKSPGEVFLPNNPENLANVRAEPTDFEFEEPVYLAPGQEYSFVVKAESTAYTVYLAEIYDFVLGSTEARVTRQPTLGSLFLSQNASTWTPDQSADLMFELFRAEFETSANALLENASVPNELLRNNPLLITNGDSDVRVFHEGHGFVLNDRVFISGLDDADSYAGIPGSAINGTRLVTAVDHTGYKIGAGEGATGSSTLRLGGDGIVASKNIMYNTFIPTVATLTPQSTTLTASVKQTEGASFGDIQGAREAAVNGAYAKDADFSSITLNEFNDTTTTQLIASDSNSTISASGNKSFSLLLNLSTSDTKVSPVIDMQRANLTAFENIIDNQDSAAADGFNIPLSFVPETHPTSGSASAKHITNQVTLEEQAVGLKILFAANRPTAANFEVYVKTGSTDDVLDTQNWVDVEPEADLPADDDGTTFRQYEFLAGGVAGNLDPFTVFQVKIVMNSYNASDAPVIQDLRVIALAT